MALASAAVGLAAGVARIAAIHGGALDLPAGREVAVGGFVDVIANRANGELSLRVETPSGRLMVRVPEPAPDLEPGTAVRAAGTIRDPGDWERGWLERLGVRDLLEADEVQVVAGTRGGLEGLFDAIRSRSEEALDSGTSPDAAALLRGFVLGQDDRIDERISDEFKRSGLAHLLAVSGQNVVLLAVLAAAVLGVLGVGLRARLLWILAAIAVYVPVAGASASIQRAGVMGAAGVIAALAGRPSSRWYALLLAAAATLGLDPRASADIGWQLSFAAVVGILLAARPIAGALVGGGGRGRRALAEGVALTVAATLATAPLMALHFGTFSIVTLPANLVALPAEAPVMWLGMLAAAVGQLPSAPAEPLSWAAGVLAGYIAQVAHWFGAPEWAQAEVGLDRPAALIGVYVALGVAVAIALRVLGRRRGLGIGRRGGPALAAALLIALVLVAPRLAADDRDAPPTGLRLTVLDVGQGDSILLEPSGAAPVLIDAGPADAGVADELAARGVTRLGALVISHPQADHDGGAVAILARLPTDRLVFARARRSTIQAARASGADTVRVAAGTRLVFGALRLDVLWPPRERLSTPRFAGADPNLVALVLVARWHEFDALLTADAEAETAPVDPGEVELLKVAHHGSADARLGDLLRRAEPQLAVISVGSANPYGHPAPSTLADLAAEHVPLLRTDLDGSITIDVADHGWIVR